MIIKPKSTVLFQGDSITDVGRNRENGNDLGAGYAFITAAWFSALYPTMNVKFLNRGISGDTVPGLGMRWQEDCIDLKPDVVSILIGINDCWNHYRNNFHETTAAEFKRGYRNLIENIKETLPETKLIIIEPFLLSKPADKQEWRMEDLNPKINVARELAFEYGALLIGADSMFAQASSLRDSTYWSEDGVHPTKAGHALLAQYWLKAVCAI